MRRASPVLLGSVALALLVACGTGGDPSTESTTTRETPSAATPTEAPTTEAPTTPTTDPTESGAAIPQDVQTAENSGPWDLVLTDVRVGDQVGFDRIVLEFAGTGTPGWAVGYVEEAVLDGSGERVSLDGDAVVDIYASGTTYPASAEDGYRGPRQFEPAAGGVVDEVHVAGTFEGYTQVLVGIDGDPAPLRVFALGNPSRLVVDVVDAG